MKETSMADAVPVSSEEVAVPKPSKKGASAGISEDVLAEIRSQIREEMVAIAAERIPVPEAISETFKVKGGVELQSHKARREDY